MCACAPALQYKMKMPMPNINATYYITKIGICLYGHKMQYIDCNLATVIHGQVLA